MLSYETSREIGNEFEEILNKFNEASELRYGSTLYTLGYLQHVLAFRIMPTLPKEVQERYREEFKERAKALEQEVMVDKLKGSKTFDYA
jgi:hypothetical protein